MRRIFSRTFEQVSQLSGVLAVFFQLSTFILIAHRVNFNWLGSHPISDLGVSYLYEWWTLGCVAGGIALTIYLFYLIKTYHPSRWFVIAFIFGILCEFATAIFPDKSVNPAHAFNNLTYIHEDGATLMLFVLPVIMLSFRMSASTNRRFKKITRYALSLYLLILIPVAVLVKKSIAYPIDELVPLLIFDLWMVYESLSDYTIKPIKPKDFHNEVIDSQMF